MKRPVEAVIEDVIIAPDKIQPIIVNFQNGELKDEEAKKMKCGVYRDEKDKYVLAMSNNNIVYKGTRPDLNKELTYTMLAVHNKKTGKIKLIQAERWNVCPVLDQHVDMNVKDEDILYELNTQFAIKKVQRKTEQYQKMKIDVNAIKDNYEQKAANIDIDTSRLEASAKDDQTLQLPRCNRDADHVSKVYDINDIVPNKLLMGLYDQAEKVAKSDLSKKPAFFVKTVETFKENEDVVEKIALLLYIECLTNWFNTPMKSAKKDSSVCPYSADVANHIVESYSVLSANGRCRPNSMRDKGIMHSIIIGLTIWNYILDLELFSSLFKFRLGLKKLQELARLLCAVPLKDDKQRVTLKLPLPAEAPRVQAKKKLKR
ncbi:uncharacterized protein LOC106640592 [Copidosoma floridanum]|uniref:uncharacterized protein LOC106640592 n=1 Tax=Copidosoma floridanum TaxID=29053 RepID=UPI0006C9DBC9|nr:uncharacterized protein LOC106640592 [Copidosoma floridanum]